MIWGIKGQNSHGAKKEETNFTKERLGRAVANKKWCEQYTEVKVNVLAARSSDTNILIIKKKGRILNKRCFKFEASWMIDDDCNT